MHVFSVAAVLLLLSSSAFTLPQQQPPNGEITVQQLLQVAPASASCDGAQFPDECATAAQAAPFINAGFSKYNISNIAEKAALISLMVSETGEFKSNVNHNNVGQGTRNMQKFVFNEEYAKTFPQLRSQVSEILQNPFQTVAELRAPEVAILSLVLPNEFSFGTAMWFYTTKCSSEIRRGVQTGGQIGFEKYLSTCVVTTVDDRVRGIFAKANTALGIIRGNSTLTM